MKKEISSLPRFILWDTLGEYTGFPSVSDDYGLFQEVTPWLDGGGFHRVVYNCLADDELKALEFACRVASALKNVCLIIEEVDTYATPNVIPNELKRLLKVGRHYGVSMIFVSRRPAEINRLITAQTRRFVLFRTTEPNDTRYLSSVIGADLSEEVRALPDLHFIDWQHGKIERGVISFQGEKRRNL